MTAAAASRGPAGKPAAATTSERPRGRVARMLDSPLASYHLVTGATALLLAFGLVMVLSASAVTAYSRHGSVFAVFNKQVLWALLGVSVFFATRRLPIRFFRVIGYPALLGSLVLMVLVPFIGKEVNYATRWIEVGPMQLQPSELMKLSLLLWGADLLARKEKLMHQSKHILVPFLPVVLVATVLTLAQKDLGTTLVLAIIAWSLLWTVGTPARVLAGLAVLGITAVGFLAVLEPYRFARVDAWLHPELYAGDKAYQAVQGLSGLASGGWVGFGLGASRQKWGYVPNQDTDFIFSIIGEELGLLGTLLVVALFTLLAYTGVRVARRAADPFSRLAASAITAWMVGQAVINMMAVLGLVPITGIPLPLISFGGTSLIVTLFALGMLASIARREPGAPQLWAARRRWRTLVQRRRVAA
ncbi:MAG: Cell division-specific peptidoglycan biosynthesis regulator FtsW [Frankiales bacterium]|nr:Cell division-specific peptidoglycan biosynthesis regulator FtsW [Frankiales bacterium]